MHLLYKKPQKTILKTQFTFRNNFDGLNRTKFFFFNKKYLKTLTHITTKYLKNSKIDKMC